MLLLSILFGAALPLAAAYAWGVVVLRRLAALEAVGHGGA